MDRVSFHSAQLAHSPSAVFMKDTRKMSTGNRADVISTTISETTDVAKEMQSLSYG